MRTLKLIDLSAIFWANYHATANESASAAFELTVGKVHQLTSADELCAICCDSQPYTRRKELHPGYKANREAAPPAALGQLRRVKERLETDGFLLWEVAGFEADDVIATACALAAREEEPLEVVIMSGDKDLAQLVDDTRSVSLFSIGTGATLRAKEVGEKFGVPPQLVRDFLALTGDKSDNVPGVPGVGPVKAAKLLEQFGDLEGVLSGAEQVTQPAMKKALIENAEVARLAYKLVGLYNDVPLDFDAVFAPRTPKPLAPKPSAAELDGDDADDYYADDAEPESGRGDALLEEVMPAHKESLSAAQAVETQREQSKANSANGEMGPTPEASAAVGVTGQNTTPAKSPMAQPAPGSETNRRDTALALPPPSFDLALQPRSFTQLVAVSSGIFSSRLYNKFQCEEAIQAVILRGREMGIPMMTSLDVFHVVEGKPTLHAHLIVERALRQPDCEYFEFIGGDDTYAEYECKSRRNKNPTRLRYTIEQAKRAGLCPDQPRDRPVRNQNGKDTRGNWEKRPDEMLRKMCAVQLTRIVFPGAALGLYAVEELAPDHESILMAA